MAVEQRRLERDLHHAIASGSLSLYFQPRVSLSSGRLTGAEALVRWPHRRRGLVLPALFIPLAEQSGLINPLGGWALYEACRAAASWPNPELAVAVNVSARQFAEGQICRQVTTALEASGLSPGRLELEITESMLLNVGTETLLALAALRDLGVGLALDDFGVGYACLSALKTLPLTILKLDRSLIRELGREAADAVIARAVIAIGHVLDLRVVAEGVETAAQQEFLNHAACDEAQGFLFGSAVPLADFRQRLFSPSASLGP